MVLKNIFKKRFRDRDNKLRKQSERQTPFFDIYKDLKNIDSNLLEKYHKLKLDFEELGYFNSSIIIDILEKHKQFFLNFNPEYRLETLEFLLEKVINHTTRSVDLFKAYFDKLISIVNMFESENEKFNAFLILTFRNKGIMLSTIVLDRIKQIVE